MHGVPFAVIVGEETRAEHGSDGEGIVEWGRGHGAFRVVCLSEEGEEVVKEGADFAVAGCRIGGGMMAVLDEGKDCGRGEDLVRYVKGDQSGFAGELRVGEEGGGGFRIAVDVEFGKGGPVAEASAGLV